MKSDEKFSNGGENNRVDTMASDKQIVWINIITILIISFGLFPVVSIWLGHSLLIVAVVLLLSGLFPCIEDQIKTAEDQL